jgi:serine/threonine protein kinase
MQEKNGSSTSMTMAAAEPKYAILAELGRGGMATAYLASMAGPGGFNKLLVVKRLRPSLAAEPEFLEMFLEEARLAARIEHPNVVHTTEVGFDGKHHYIAMEYLDGQSFENVTRRLLKQRKSEQSLSGGPPSSGELGGESGLPLKFHLHVISQALLALDCAHELKDFNGEPLNVVHRDVSPHNIVVTYDGHVKLLDFGIAKAADSSGDTRTGVMKGKCAYMPAEQFGGRSVDRRADIFAVGVIMWQALTGRRLWRGLSDAEIFQKVAGADIRAPRQLDSEIPAELEAICMKALAHKREDRFATASEFQVALEDYIAAHADLRTSSRELGKFISDLFAEDRIKMKGVIEAQLGKASSTKSMSIPVLGGQSHSGLGMTPGANPSQSSLAFEPTALSEPARRPRNVRLWGASAAAAAAIVVVAAFTTSRHREHLARESAVTPAAVSLSSTTAMPSGATTSLLHVTSVPSGAKLSFDGAPLDGNPFSSSFNRDGLTHRIQADAPGFAPKSEWVTLDQADVAVTLTLDPVKALDAGRPAAAVSRPSWGAGRRQPVVDSASTPQTSAPTTPNPPQAPSSAQRGPQLDKADPWAPAGH